MNFDAISRRQVLAASAGLALGPFARLGRGQELRGTLRKAMIVGAVSRAMLEPLKEAGFDGVETTHVCGEDEAAKRGGTAKSMGLRVHSVLRGWMEFNSPDPKKVEDSLEQTRQALRAAKAYGADDILLVPCRVGDIPMPEPWEFKIEFDEKTGHVTRVADDNDKYAQYIDAQNRATDTSRAAVEKLIPLAEELKVVIGLENVWNNLWVEPKLYRHFVSSFNNKWVRSYFDIGNVVKYSPPQNWIRTLGPDMIVRLHVKDFKLNPDGHNGTFVHPRDGSIDWPAVRQALSDVNYDGWASIEDGGLPLPEFARRFDLIAAGK